MSNYESRFEITKGDLMPPFKSKKQAAYLFANNSKVAKEFAAKTKGFKSLPEKVKKKAIKRASRAK